MAYERSKSTWDNPGKFIQQFKPETKTLIKKLEKILIKSYVTYWPWTQPSTKKLVHPVEDIRVSLWPVDGLNAVQLRRPQEAGGYQTIM